MSTLTGPAVTLRFRVTRSHLRISKFLPGERDIELRSRVYGSGFRA